MRTDERPPPFKCGLYELVIDAIAIADARLRGERLRDENFSKVQVVSASQSYCECT